ncbi:MAG: hypothetical protein WCI47_00300 [bacterium]
MDIERNSKDAVTIISNRRKIQLGLDMGTGADVNLGIMSKNPGETGVTAQGSFSEPGEYEVQGIMIDGVKTGDHHISFHIISDNTSCAALGLQKADELTDTMIEHLQPSNVLLVWLAEGTPSDFASLVGKFEAAVIIPVSVPFSSEELDAVLKMSNESVEKFKLVQKDLSVDQPKLIQLT